MDYIRIEQIRDDVIAIRPVYSEDGDVSEVITRSGEVLVDKRQVRSVLKGLLHSYGLDIKYQHQLIRERLNRKSVMPCFLPEERVFIPLKMRKPAVAGDNVYGYIDVYSLKDISLEGKNECGVLLENDIRLDILSSKATILKAQDSGNKLRKLLGDKGKPGSSDYTQQMVAWSIVLGQTLGGLKEQMDRIERDMCYIREEITISK